jgi:hypothetical protein
VHVRVDNRGFGGEWFGIQSLPCAEHGC